MSSKIYLVLAVLVCIAAAADEYVTFTINTSALERYFAAEVKAGQDQLGTLMSIQQELMDIYATAMAQSIINMHKILKPVYKVV